MLFDADSHFLPKDAYDAMEGPHLFRVARSFPRA